MSEAVVSVAERLLELGCDEICLADTIGTATPESVQRRVAGGASVSPDRSAGIAFS